MKYLVIMLCLSLACPVLAQDNPYIRPVSNGAGLSFNTLNPVQWVANAFQWMTNNPLEAALLIGSVLVVRNNAEPWGITGGGSSGGGGIEGSEGVYVHVHDTYDPVSIDVRVY